MNSCAKWCMLSTLLSSLVAFCETMYQDSIILLSIRNSMFMGNTCIMNWRIFNKQLCFIIAFKSQPHSLEKDHHLVASWCHECRSIYLRNLIYWQCVSLKKNSKFKSTISVCFHAVESFKAGVIHMQEL